MDEWKFQRHFARNSNSKITFSNMSPPTPPTTTTTHVCAATCVP